MDKTETGLDIELDEKTQAVIKGIVNNASQQVKQLQDIVQERIGLIITSYVNAKGKEGNYVVNKDFTKLEVIKSEGG